MKAAVLHNQRKPLLLENIATPIPGPSDILIKVKACGICHSDLHLLDGDWEFHHTPRIPGHEIVGTVFSFGDRVKNFQKGDLVGLTWVNSTCQKCSSCKMGDPVLCEHQQVTGVTVDGGYAEYVNAPATAYTRIPSSLSPELAAPLLCAGLTAFAGLKLANLQNGESVVVHGLGGLGHLAIQIAKNQGGKVITLTRSREKADLALKLGSDAVVDLSEKDSVSGLNELNGADVIFSSSIMPVSIGRLIHSLKPNGRLIVVGGGRGTFQVNPIDLIARRLRIIGSPVGNKEDLSEVLKLGAEGKIKASVETYPLEKVNEALNRLRHGKVRFRAVLTF
ncbi:MAG: alcohol dehydrogenase catalytic domain-containing protein [Nitrospiria bacterium]